MTARSIALLTLFVAQAAMGAVSQPPRVELPIRERDLSDGMRRYWIPVVIDGVEMQAALDTGSTGLRVLSWRLNETSRPGPKVGYSYTSGLRIEGRLSNVQLVLGPASGKLPAQLIDDLGCTPSHPDCPGERLSRADYGLEGDGLKDQGFPAIVGVNMALNAARNPFIAMGFARWIVELPRPGQSTPGRLILNPSNEEVAGFTHLDLIPELMARNGAAHDALLGCLVRQDGSTKLCGPVIFDTGAPGLRISLDDFKAPWPDNTPARLLIGEDKTAAAVDFKVGRPDEGSGMFRERLGEGAVPRISAGIMPYFAWAVLYDPNTNSIGLRPR